ncbi:MAG: YigZ family protein, partial [Gammaproteobacteria bacterium]|nr:YigZ family protein [Gammaproteobacteria bacterium]
MGKSYLIPSKANERQIEIKKSRFIAYACHVSSRDDVMKRVEDIRRQYVDARHYCWAYLLGNPDSASSAAMNDDSEPSGTAGKPILNVIQHKNIGDILVVVTRYFGGIKLGAGGLTRAYSRAAEEVISTLELKLCEPVVKLEICCDFSREQLVRLWLEKLEASLKSINYQEKITMQLAISERQHEALIEYCNQYG